MQEHLGSSALPLHRVCHEVPEPVRSQGLVRMRPSGSPVTTLAQRSCCLSWAALPHCTVGEYSHTGTCPILPSHSSHMLSSLPGCRVRHHLPAEAEPTHVHRYHARAAAQLSLTIKPLCLNRLFCINGLLLHTHWDKGNKAKAQITETTVRKIVGEETKAFIQSFLQHCALLCPLSGVAAYHCSALPATLTLALLFPEQEGSFFCIQKTRDTLGTDKKDSQSDTTHPDYLWTISQL